MVRFWSPGPGETPAPGAGHNRRMLFRARHRSAPVSVSLRDRSCTASIGRRRTTAADGSGRLYSFFAAGRMYRRGLDGRVLCRWTSGGRRHSAWLDAEGASRVVAAAARTGERLLRSFDAWEWVGAPPEAGERAALRAALSRSAAFTLEAAARDAERFAATYAPIGILPPDHYLSLVLQATEGCSFNSCTFCELYQRPYRVRTVSEFGAHIEAVRTLFGAGLPLRASAIFLAAANALAVPMARLVPLFEEIARRLPPPPRGIHAFVDGFTGEKKSVADYRRLRALGLRRVYLGLESGDDALLAFVRKPATSGQVIETVARLKAAGVHVAPIVLVGLGGRPGAAGHVRETARVLNALALGPDDLVYFSDLVDEPGAAYPEAARAAGLVPLDAGERAQQRREIEAGVRWAGDPPRRAGYNYSDFIY